jgi:thiosulfate/3-mercaptopyruvate sulfurtransferase
MVSKLITAHNLLEKIQSRCTLHILDTTFTLPDLSPIENHFKNRIPNSKFLDMKSISDPSSGLTMTMPSESLFISHMRKLGVKNDDTPLVLYDKQNMTSPRAWFMFKVFGRKNVVVLDGGLSKWLSESFPVESGQYSLNSQPDESSGYEYSKDSSLIKSFEEVVQNIQSKSFQVLDARPSKAFNEGKIPNSFNSPFDSLYNKDLTFKSPDEIRAHYGKVGINLNGDIVNACRIGHSASVNLFALELIGKQSKLYDGSWEEWSKRYKSN